jgi:hypothetical protein
MSYIPFSTEEITRFPQAFSKDLKFAIERLEEKWKRHYPIIDYHELRLDYDRPEAVNDGGIVRPVETGDSTTWDDLWGEDLPDFQSDITYSNPHSQVDSPEADANVSQVFCDPVPIHVHMLEQATEYQLKKMGRDLMHDVVATFLTPLLDAQGLTIKSGDRLAWGGRTCQILDVKNRGFWKMTNIFLFLECDCEEARYGS